MMYACVSNAHCPNLLINGTKVNLTDTHTHLYSRQFDSDRNAMVQRALAAGVHKMYLPNVDSTSIDAMLALEAAYPAHCFAMMGLHPCSVQANYQDELALVREWLDRRPFVAIGEIGIDLYWDKTHIEAQQEAFLTQCEWAKALDIPIVIHTREATERTIDLVREVKDERLRGIFHCFGGTAREAEAIIDLGFHLGIGGVLTYPKSGLDKTLEVIDLQYIVLETDAPYLAPIPHRGKRNESAYVELVAERLAAVKQTTLERIATVTSATAEKIFAKKTKSLPKQILQEN